MSVPTPTIIQQEISAVMNADWLDYLYQRWQDESEYEDINDYGKAFAKHTGFTVTKSMKRPFGFQFTHPKVPGALYEMTLNRRSSKWRRLK